MKKDIPIYIIILTLIIGAIWIGRFALTQREHASYTIQKQAQTEKSEYSIGDDLRWSVTLCKLHSEPFYSQRTLENQTTGAQYPIPEFNTKSSLSKGECGELHPSIVIPKNSNLEAGTYKLHSVIFILSSKLTYKPFDYYTNEFQIK